MDDPKFNVTIEKGTPWSFMFDLSDMDDHTLNFTGYTVRCQMRKMNGALVATPTASITNVGLVTLSLTNDQVALIPSSYNGMDQYDVAEYDVILDPPTPNTNNIPSMRVLHGLVFIRGGVTR